MWSPPSDNFPTTDGWTGYRSLLIKSEKISVDSSAFHHVTGILYLENQDALVITLFDGSLWLLQLARGALGLSAILNFGSSEVVSVDS